MEMDLIKMDVMKKKKRKGFTLIELIVVIAIIGILAAIAIPKFSGLQATSKLKADGSTAAQIVSAARLQETETNKTVVGLTGAAPALQASYMTVPTDAQSGGKYAISGGGSAGAYIIKWTSTTSGYVGEQTYTENEVFAPKAAQ